MKPSMMKTLAVVLLAAPPLMLASGSEAHAHLVKASPAQNTTVTAPAVIDLQFSERLEPRFSGVDLMTAGGAGVAVTAEVSATDGKAIHAVPKAALRPGAYMVMWHVVSADGHKMTGQYSFTVR